MVVLTTENYKIWCKNVKSQLLSYGSKIWRIVCESCGKDPIADKVLKKDAQAQ